MQLVEAQLDDVAFIATSLLSMTPHASSLDLIQSNIEHTLNNADIAWFIFKDDAGRVVGTCHCQSLFNYWRVGKRYFVSGFYIDPECRRQGYAQKALSLICEWAKAEGAVKLCAIIHDDNEASIKAFDKAGFANLDNQLYLRDLNAS